MTFHLFADGSVFVDGDVEDEDGSLVCEHGEDGAGVLGPGHVRDLQRATVQHQSVLNLLTETHLTSYRVIQHWLLQFSEQINQ